MQSNEEPEQKRMFECQLCGLTVPYNYYGQKPPNPHSIVLLEKCYTMKDPFTPDKDKFLILGAHCHLCNTAVCVEQECSLFYTKRFCIPCVKQNLEEFPEEIQSDLEKKEKAQASK